MPPQYRMVLVLHDMEDLSTAEVAKIMGLREGTVRVRLHRARLFVRQHLARLAKAGRDTGLTLHASAEEAKPTRCRGLFAALSDYMDGVIDDAMCDEMDLHLARLPAVPGIPGEPEERRGPVPVVSSQVRFPARRTAPPATLTAVPARGRRSR